MIKPQLV